MFHQYKPLPTHVDKPDKHAVNKPNASNSRAWSKMTIFAIFASLFLASFYILPFIMKISHHCMSKGMHSASGLNGQSTDLFDSDLPIIHTGNTTFPQIPTSVLVVQDGSAVLTSSVSFVKSLKNRVQAEWTVYSNDELALGYTNLTVSLASDNQLLVNLSSPIFKWPQQVRVQVTVALPASSVPDFKVEGEAIAIEVLGPASLQAFHSTTKAGHSLLKALDVETGVLIEGGAGAVDLINVSTPSTIEITSKAGSVTLENVSCSSLISTASAGRVSGTHITASHQQYLSNAGSVVLKNVEGYKNLTVSTYAGSVQVENAVPLVNALSVTDLQSTAGTVQGSITGFTGDFTAFTRIGRISVVSEGPEVVVVEKSWGTIKGYVEKEGGSSVRVGSTVGSVALLFN